MSDANLVLFSLLGGTALLLYGVRLVGEGLQRAAGARLRHVLASLSGDRFRALAVGCSERAPLDDLHPECAEVLGRDGGHFDCIATLARAVAPEPTRARRRPPR